MRKLTTILSICAMIFAVSCADGLDANASQNGGVNPAETLKPGENGATGNLKTVADFINHYAGVYYSQGLHYYKHDNSTDTGYKVDYKFRNGQIYTFNQHNEAFELIVEPVEAVLPSQNKAQLRHKEKGEVLVLNMTDEGLETYVSYILEKVSDEVLIQNEGVGGFIEELAQYKGTYNSIAQDNKIENYIAIDGEGNVYFHDANVTVEGGRVGITEGEGLTIIESYQNTMRKIIFKFDEGVYRRFSIDGEHRDYTYIGVCERTEDFIEDRFANATYRTSDFKTEGHDTDWGFYPDKVTGLSLTLNEDNDDVGHMVSQGAVAVEGQIGSRLAKGDMVAHVSVLKGNTLHIMGRYDAQFVFSDDWQTATYNGQTLSLVSGEVKNAAPATRKVKRITKRF